MPRSKTGVCQTYLLWPETQELLEEVNQQQTVLINRMAKRNIHPNNNGHVFITK